MLLAERQDTMTDWGAILAAHGEVVWRTVYRLLNHREDALDCYQETFLAAFRSAQAQTIADWASFLITLATRRAMDRLRRRYQAGPRFVSVDTITEPTMALDGPPEQAGANELMERVRQGMAGLPEKQAEVFWLSCLEGLSHQQIAEVLQTPCAEVRV